MLLSSVAPIALFAFWEPIGGIVWSIESPVAQALIYGAFAFAAMATNIHPPKVPDTRAVPEEARLS